MSFDFQAALAFLQQLMRIDCTEGVTEEGHPFGKNLSLALDFVLNKMSELGFETENLDNFCGTASIGSGEGFDVLGHLDTVPVGDGWKYPPFAAEIHDGVLYGRGALDDKGPTIAAVYAAARLLSQGYVPTKRLRFIFGLDEESGWKCMERFQKDHTFAPYGFSPDGDFPAINAEKGMFHFDLTIPRPDGVLAISAAERANIVPNKATLTYLENGHEKTLSATGIAAHASHPEQGDNALIKLLATLKNIYPSLAALADIFDLSDGSHAGLKISDTASGDLTLNLGTARVDGDSVCFELDVRCPVTYDKGYVIDVLKGIGAFSVKQGFFHEPLYIPPDNAFIGTLVAAYNRVTGQHEKPIAVGGGTYARLLPIGCAFGPALPGIPCPIHQVDECMSIDHFKLMTDVYYEALRELCFTEPRPLRVTLLGDSITAGVVLDGDGKYGTVGIENTATVAGAGHAKINNASAFGLTAKKAYARKMHLKTATVDGEQSDVLLIALGGNDCDYDWQQVSDGAANPQPKLSPEDYRRTLQAMIDETRQSGVLPAIMTLTPLSADRYFDWITRERNADRILAFLNGSAGTLYSWQELYSHIAREVAVENNLPLVDMRQAFLRTQNIAHYLAADGIHLNADGHALAVAEFIKAIATFDRQKWSIK